ncbi:helix-turn-helix domain-containing protein [Streptomyces sp. 549]|uniref:helix-turn-helix domain-containing protein n=1 Tax=Streptomyces sp. 549 TaxID=3049076 RepID=UPI0024C4087C|nr:helix-turn-helix domain-containing protein [Streptomyces sp. 549]MDK1475252.1 helix-turn-helix domain-containing protein [Streptomyces sp. 549]
MSEQPGPSRPQPPADDPQVRTLDPRSLRALAHPLRLRILSALREYGPATASGLAERLSESSGATSYHLRQLAAHTFVVEDTERGTARERWWRAAQRGTRLDRVDELHQHPDPEVAGALSTFLHEVAATHARETETWLATQSDWSAEWRRDGQDLSDFSLQLTAAQTRELTSRLHDVIQEYRDHNPEAADTPAGVERVRVHLHAFPRKPG